MAGRTLREQVRFIDRMVEQLLDERIKIVHELRGGEIGADPPRNPHLKPMSHEDLMFNLRSTQEARAEMRESPPMKPEDREVQKQVIQQEDELRDEAQIRALEIGRKAGVFK